MIKISYDYDLTISEQLNDTIKDEIEKANLKNKDDLFRRALVLYFAVSEEVRSGNVVVSQDPSTGEVVTVFTNIINQNEKE
ncbi:hypothetical protein LCGC14_1162840 [marine sediment metagenome]|uniref:Uncharacterized protein n=1 Tax=marine sediment metagenome TaxID=412755 RepID=A0A0F9LS11_9ZZZZ|nr:hypothetical protein [Candidatus Scalindua sp.]